MILLDICAHVYMYVHVYVYMCARACVLLGF